MADADAVLRAIAAIRAGGVVILPTDTVYGLVARGDSGEATRQLHAVKGRETTQPTAVLFPSVGALMAHLPGLPADALAAAWRLLPGPFTLVLPNPDRAFAWLSGDRPETLGVRVPVLPPASARVLAAAGCLVATSANVPGGPEPRTLDDVPAVLRALVAEMIDGGPLPGRPSTVLDLTGPEPLVLREGAVLAADALARLRD